MNEFQCLRPAVNHFGFFPPLPPPVVAVDTPADELSPLSFLPPMKQKCWVHHRQIHINGVVPDDNVGCCLKACC